jgi:hypothetical protein
VKFSSDALPDGKQHAVTFAIKTADQSSGSVTDAYVSAKLTKVTPVKVDGLRNGDAIDADRNVVVTLGGQKTWASTKLELFNDCAAGTCAAVATSTNGHAEWRIAASPLSQGDHQLAIRVTASDGQREFSDTQVVHYARAGTSFNLGAISLFLGAGGIAIAATAIIIRRRVPTAEL